MKKDNYFGPNLKRLRKRLGLSQTVMAEKINASTGARLRHNVISNYENGLTMPSLGLVPTIASILGTSVDYLLGHGQSATEEDHSLSLSKEDRLMQLREEQLNLQPFLHIPRIEVDKVSRPELESILSEQYDLIDKLLKEVTRLKDDNINSKEKLLTLREKFEKYLGK